MLSSVLNSERAVQVNIAIMRTFVQLRWLMDSNADLARKIESLEKKYDEKFATVFAAIKQLIAPTEPAKKRIGFHTSLLTSDLRSLSSDLCPPTFRLSTFQFLLPNPFIRVI